MESVGARLRAARLSRGLTIDEVAQATKLRPASLEFLENDAYQSLPALTFVRGFVRAFASVVGENGDELVRRLPSPNGRSMHHAVTREAHFARIIGMGGQRTPRVVSTQGVMLLVAVGMLVAAWWMGGSTDTTDSAELNTKSPTVEVRPTGSSSLTATRDR